MARRRMGLVASIFGLAGLMVTGTVARTPRGPGPTFEQAALAISEGGVGPVIIAHRGNGCGGEENSVRALESCLRAGVRAVEIDIRYTSDGIPVLMHDRGLFRTTGHLGTVDGTDYATLRGYRLRDGSAIPRLEDVLREYRGKLLFDLDLKEQDLRPTVEAMARADAFGSAYLRTYLKKHHAQVQGLQVTYPDLQVMPSLHHKSDLQTVRSHGFKYLVAEVPQDTRPEFIKELVETGITVQSRIRYPFFQCEQYEDMRLSGISIIQTDAPLTILEDCERPERSQEIATKQGRTPDLNSVGRPSRAQ